jgi:hypothetical protein
MNVMFGKALLKHALHVVIFSAVVLLLARCDLQSPTVNEPSNASKAPDAAYATQSVSASDFADLQQDLANDPQVVQWLSDTYDWISDHERNLTASEINDIRAFYQSFYENYGANDWGQLEIPADTLQMLEDMTWADELQNNTSLMDGGEYIIDGYPQVQNLSEQQKSNLFVEAWDEVSLPAYEDPNELDAGGGGDDGTLLGFTKDPMTTYGSCDRDKVDSYNECYFTQTQNRKIQGVAGFTTASIVFASCMSGSGGSASPACGIFFLATYGVTELSAYWQWHNNVSYCQNQFGDHGCDCQYEDNFATGVGCKLENAAEGTEGAGGSGTGSGPYYSPGPYPSHNGGSSWVPDWWYDPDVGGGGSEGVIILGPMTIDEWNPVSGGDCPTNEGCNEL